MKANEFIETLIKRRVRKYYDTEKFLFRKLMITMNSSSEFKEIEHILEYADAIRIESVEIVETDTGGYDERDEPLQQGNIISTYYRYIQTESRSRDYERGIAQTKLQRKRMLDKCFA